MAVEKMDTVDSWPEDVSFADTLGKEDPDSVNIDPDSLFLLVD